MQRVNYVSVLRYVQRVSAALEFSGLSFSCDPSELLENGSVCPFTSGEQVLALYHFEPTILQDTLIALALTFAYRVCGFLLLARRRRVLQQ
jgi:hypothetical protein